MNGSFYAWSWYLDSVCDDWEVLMEGDYESAMILPVKKKYYISYLSQPFLAKQLGIYSINNLSKEKSQEFVQRIPDKFKWTKLNMNKFNQIQLSNWKESKQKVFELDLILKANKLSQKVSAYTQNMLIKANHEGFSLIKNLSPNDYIKLWKSATGNARSNASEEENTIRRVLSKGIQHRVCKIQGVFSKYNNLVCCGVFFNFQRKITLLSFVNDSNEKDLRALTWMISKFIHENAGKNLTLRFELPEYQNKSNLRKKHQKRSQELSEIFSGFGAQTFLYPIIESKDSVFWIKFLKPFL